MAMTCVIHLLFPVGDIKTMSEISINYYCKPVIFKDCPLVSCAWNFVLFDNSNMFMVSNQYVFIACCLKWAVFSFDLLLKITPDTPKWYTRLSGSVTWCDQLINIHDLRPSVVCVLVSSIEFLVSTRKFFFCLQNFKWRMYYFPSCCGIEQLIKTVKRNSQLLNQESFAFI